MKTIFYLFLVIPHFLFASEQVLVQCNGLSSSTEKGIGLEIRGEVKSSPKTFTIEVLNSTLVKTGAMPVNKCSLAKTGPEETKWIKCTTVGGGDISIYNIDLRIRIGNEEGGLSKITLKYLTDNGKDMERLSLTGKNTDCIVTDF